MASGNRTTIKYVALALLPLLCVLLMLSAHGMGFNLLGLVPTWSDEYTGWFPETMDVIYFGKTLGYNGYNGNHAEIGTWGPWGIGPLIPYAIFARLFLWAGYACLPLTNIFLLCLAMLAFCLIVRPNGRQVLNLAIVYLFSFITQTYSITAMSEGEKYAMAIVLAGIVIRWLKAEKKIGTGEKIAVWIFVFVATQVFLIFALVVPVLVFLQFVNKWKYGKKLGDTNVSIPKGRIILWFLVAVLATLVFTFVGQIVFAKTGAPYMDASVIDTCLDMMKTEGFLTGVKWLIKNSLNNLSVILPHSYIYEVGGVLPAYFATYLVLMLVMLLGFFTHFFYTKNRYVATLHILAFYFLLGFIMGYVILYTGVAWTLCRGTNNGFLIACLLGTQMETKLVKAKSFNFFIPVILVLYLFSIREVWNYHGEIVSERASVGARADEYRCEMEALSAVLVLDEDTCDPWDNTIGEYGLHDPMWNALPYGFGKNCMLYNGNVVNTAPRWAVVRGEYPEVVVELGSAGYEVIYKDEYFTVCRR